MYTDNLSKQFNYLKFNDGKSVHESYDNNQKYLEYRKNWIKNPREKIVRNYPLNVDLELTNACNLKCSYCARTHDNWGKSDIGFISEKIFEKVIAEIGDGQVYCLKLSLRGEPLLHKNIIKFLSSVKKTRLIDFYFNTNGVLLTQEISEKFIDLELPRISFSVGGWDKLSFNKSQNGAQFEQVYDNIRKLKEIRDRLKKFSPRIRIQAVLTEELKENLIMYKKLWDPIADEVGLIDFREESGVYNIKEIKDKNFSCNFLWQRIVILWDGSAFPCLFHGVKDNKDLYLGNVMEKTIFELWNGPKFQHLRKQHTNGKSHEISSCEICSYRYSILKK